MSYVLTLDCILRLGSGYPVPAKKAFKRLPLENMICAIMLRRENVESQFLGNSYLNVHISDLILSCAFHGGIGSNFIFCSKLNFGFCVYNFGLMVYITIKLLPK